MSGFRASNQPRLLQGLYSSRNSHASDGRGDTRNAPSLSAPRQVGAFGRDVIQGPTERAHSVGDVMQFLLILNDPPYGTERVYNGLRLGLALAKVDDAQVTIFLMADAVGAARRGQNTPEGYYNIERMVKRLVVAPHRVLLCGTCMDARGLSADDVLEGAARSTMDELARATISANKVIVY